MRQFSATTWSSRQPSGQFDARDQPLSPHAPDLARCRRVKQHVHVMSPVACTRGERLHDGSQNSIKISRVVICARPYLSIGSKFLASVIIVRADELGGPVRATLTAPVRRQNPRQGQRLRRDIFKRVPGGWTKLEQFVETAYEFMLVGASGKFPSDAAIINRSSIIRGAHMHIPKFPH